MNHVRFIALLVVLVSALAACAGGDSPAGTMEAYLRARAGGDLDAMLRLSCVAWEQQALIEAKSFESMNAELVGMACQQSAESDGSTLVECEGVISTVYNGEIREWDLGAFSYQLRQEGGEWRMCGYADAP
jgi:hypothetical protein